MTPAEDAARWKWIAGSLAAVMIAGLTPSIGWFIDSRDRVNQNEFNTIVQRQQLVLQRLAVAEVQLQANTELLMTIQTQLREHENP